MPVLQLSIAEHQNGQFSFAICRKSSFNPTSDLYQFVQNSLQILSIVMRLWDLKPILYSYTIIVPLQNYTIIWEDTSTESEFVFSDCVVCCCATARTNTVRVLWLVFDSFLQQQQFYVQNNWIIYSDGLL